MTRPIYPLELMLDVKQPYSNYSGKENDRELYQRICLKSDGETRYDNNSCDGSIGVNNTNFLTSF